VHCIGWVEIGGKAKGHVEYEIRVLTKSVSDLTRRAASDVQPVASMSLHSRALREQR